MVDEILKFTKFTFLIHFIVAVLMAILYFIPDVTYPMFGMTPTPILISTGMTIAALFLGLGIMSLCGYLAKEWKEVKIVVIGEIVWLGIGTIVTIINFNANASAGTLFFIVGGAMLALFILSFLQQEEKIKPLLK